MTALNCKYAVDTHYGNKCDIGGRCIGTDRHCERRDEYEAEHEEQREEAETTFSVE